MNEKKEFEIFSDSLNIGGITDKEQSMKEPSAFNCQTRVRRVKVTLEKIEESEEIIINRLKELYAKETNWHNKSSMDKYCKEEFGFRVCDKMSEDEKNEGS